MGSDRGRRRRGGEEEGEEGWRGRCTNYCNDGQLSGVLRAVFKMAYVGFLSVLRARARARARMLAQYCIWQTRSREVTRACCDDAKGCSKSFCPCFDCIARLSFVHKKETLNHTVPSGSNPSIALCRRNRSILEQPHQFSHCIVHHHLCVAFNENVELWVLARTWLFTCGVE